ncbi:MAG: tyrosine-type recombinase/integrase [Bacteroidia bacterium]|nr:tyrosine-type recombinase/integrase [Bacteroidia bacterium]
MTIRFRIYSERGSRRPEASFTNVYVRLRDGSGIDQTVRTDILVRRGCWDKSRECVRANVQYPPEERAVVDAAVAKLRAHIATTYVADKIEGSVGVNWLRDCLLGFYKKASRDSFSELFEAFLAERELSPQRVKQYRSLANCIKRYETYLSEKRKSPYVFEVWKIEPKDLNDFWRFLSEEHKLCLDSPALMAAYADGKPPRPRGQNTINDLFKKLRAFFHWAEHEGHIKRTPFESYHIAQELYGTPVSLTTEEVRTIATHDFGRRNSMARQRDVFVFQCNVGCRVSDLLRLKKSDVEEGKVSFIPSKTIKENPRTVVVPLNSIAMDIVSRYVSLPQEELLPFISVQKYNMEIKKILRECGVTRMVAVLDPVTRREKRVQICDVASSHLARRTFVNNIYRQVKDPALVSALTGHVEGSKAFSRYRDIDDDVKRELVEMLE